jgi:two-component system, OmpR family, phosphate regulon sensor histidine kinase PhoR
MNSTRRIGLLLALVFVLPALFFSVYEISSMSRDEAMIQEVYQKQLEAILFSVNQYSDDVVNTWITKVENGIDQASTWQEPTEINELLSYNPPLRSLFVADTISGKLEKKIFSIEQYPDKLTTRIDSAIELNKSKIEKLIEYKQNNFQKIDVLPYHWSFEDSIQCLVFITDNKLKRPVVAGMMIDQEVFIQDVIGPRLQVVAKDQFVLSVFRKGSNQSVYSTRADSVRHENEVLVKDLWLLPEYNLGIRRTGSSIQALIDKRLSTNLTLIILLDVILVVAVILVFRNVKREVQLAQNKADFVSNVSHEIRTPLALISMFAETLEMNRVKSEEKKHEYYSIISKEAQRLSGIVNKILNFSQTEANKKVLHPGLLHPQTEVNEILKTYDFHLKNKGFEYSVTTAEDVWIMADREAFVESIINLIDNAVKYSDGKKLLEISIGRENGFGFVSVKDHGIGIKPRDQKYIFDKFYRVSSGDLAKSRGTGLGLSLVKQLMENQHGKVTVSSEIGKGSLFTLYFPMAKDKV